MFNKRARKKEREIKPQGSPHVIYDLRSRVLPVYVERRRQRYDQCVLDFPVTIQIIS